VGGGVGEAGDLLVLAGEVHDRVEHEVGEPEGAVDTGGGEVADRHLNVVATRLGLSRATIAADRSIPCTATLRRLSGTAMRPVPMPRSGRVRRRPARRGRRRPARRQHRRTSPEGLVVRRRHRHVEIVLGHGVQRGRKGSDRVSN
jgi:hypothetical protein